MKTLDFKTADETNWGGKKELQADRSAHINIQLQRLHFAQKHRHMSCALDC